MGCGCRGRMLAARLREDGHAVRGTTRSVASLPVIAQAGAEPFLGDPDRIGTLSDALEHVTVTCWLMGSAAGPEDAVAALHGTRLERIVEECVDTTVRGFLYEAAGPLPAELYAAGRDAAAAACAGSEIPFAALTADPGDPQAWVQAAQSAIEGLLSAERRG